MLLLQLVSMIYFDGAIACCNVTHVFGGGGGGACATVTVSRRNIHCMFLHYLRHRCICIFYCIETSSKWSVQLSTLKHLHIIISMDKNLIAYSALQRNYTERYNYQIDIISFDYHRCKTVSNFNQKTKWDSVQQRTKKYFPLRFVDNGFMYQKIFYMTNGLEQSMTAIFHIFNWIIAFSMEICC